MIQELPGDLWVSDWSEDRNVTIVVSQKSSSCDLSISASQSGHLLNKFAYIRYSHKRSVSFFSEKETA
jgi:hypothetical protein